MIHTETWNGGCFFSHIINIEVRTMNLIERISRKQPPPIVFPIQHLHSLPFSPWLSLQVFPLPQNKITILTLWRRSGAHRSHSTANLETCRRWSLKQNNLSNNLLFPFVYEPASGNCSKRAITAKQRHLLFKQQLD